MIEGSQLDQMLDAHFAKLVSQGMTEEQILQQMMGGKKSGLGNDSANGEEVNVDASQLNIDKDLFKEFEKVMKAQGMDKEMENFGQHLQDVTGKGQPAATSQAVNPSTETGDDDHSRGKN